MAKCLILGANGFLGSHLVDELDACGHNVFAFDKFSGTKRNFKSTKAKIIDGDFLNVNDLTKALKGIEYVFHFISTTTPATAEDDPLKDIETNVKMSIKLFQECVKANIKRVIFASTGGAIYGDNSSEKVNEHTLHLPISPYAIGKLSIEQYLQYFDRKFGLKALVFRISNPYGSRQSFHRHQGVIPIFLQHIANHEPITIFGDGNMVRDYIYVKDVVSMIAKSFQTAQHSLYNLGSGRGNTISELVDIMRKVTNYPIQIEYTDKPSTFVDKVILDISRFTDEFQTDPLTELEEGIKHTWNYVLNNQQADET